MPLPRRPDTSQLSVEEMRLAIRSPKFTVDPERGVKATRTRTEEEVEVYLVGEPILANKGVQLKIAYTVNAGGQLRHRFFDESRSQPILNFHVEDNHIRGGKREPHLVFAPESPSMERALWDVPPAVTYQESKALVLTYLSIEVRPTGLDRF